MAGDTGFRIALPDGDLPPHIALFSESASRVVVSVDPVRAAALEALAARHDTPFARLGETGGPDMAFDGLFEIPVAEAREVYETAIPLAMSRRTSAA